MVSKYLGAGPAAETQATQAGGKRQQRMEAEKAWAEYKKVGVILEDIQALTQALTRATLLVEGYHTHRGQWRKKRDD